MRNASGWMARRFEASEHSVLMSVWASRQEAAGRGMAFSGMTSVNQVVVGLDSLQRELDAILRELTSLPRFGYREQRLLRTSLVAFVERTASNILTEGTKGMPGGVASAAQSVCSSSLQKLKANVSLWDDLITQRRVDQVMAVLWEAVRMIGSAALGVLAARLLI